ncbi:helix-turn-helix domain-containing protein [Streptomyces sp. NPDC058052]|uniref:helix-turn-helix domain-containing protein n=1 Tax=Streptomyces sp. NPDC058052 TaxID=3346316 RepID=UPI0036E523F0
MQTPNEAIPFRPTDIHSLRDFLLHQRRMSGWTQEELSERSGVSVRTIRNLETGTNINPRRSSVSLLLSAFGATASALDKGAPAESGGWPAPVPHPEAERPAADSGPPPWYGPRPLPAPLVGRQADLRHLLGAVQRGRLVVLTGPGGVGKTRLALAAAARLLPLFQDGVAVAELHDCPPEHIDPVRAATELNRITGDLVRSDISTREDAGMRRQLLVLDSAEHVVQQTARVVRGLLDAHPGLHVLVTSRRTMAVSAAETWEVEPLDTGVRARGESAVPSAVELFLRRVQASLPTLDLSSRLPLVRELCALLDGIPLAIELAAGRLRSLPLTSLVDDDTLFHLLARVDAGDLSRHRTLSSSVRWSYELLPNPHRELLHRLTALPRTFSLDDALTIPGPDDTAGAPHVAHLLAELADASLVQIHRERQYNYRVHSLVRHFVTEVAAPAEESAWCAVG